MERDSCLSKLQKTLLDLNNRELLNSTEFVLEVVKELSELVGKATDFEKSRIASFMVLNTKWQGLEELKKNISVGLFSNFTPVIEQNYLVSYLYDLGLQLHIIKVVENCPSDLTVNLIDFVVKKIKETEICKTKNGIVHISMLWRALYVRVWKIQNKYCLDGGSKHLVLKFKDFGDFIKNIIFNSIKACSGQQPESFLKTHLSMFFENILYFINLKNSKENIVNEEIYKLSVSLLSNSSGDQNQDNLLNECLQAAFIITSEVLENLTNKMPLILSECTFPKHANLSMQQVIDDYIFQVKCLIMESGDVWLKNFLPCLNVKSTHNLESFKKADISKDKGKNNAQWFKTLVRKPNFIHNNTFKSTLENLFLADNEDISLVLKRTWNLLNKFESEILKKLFLTCLKLSEDCVSWVDKLFQDYTPNLLCTSNSKDELVEIFNKVSEDSEVTNNSILCLAVQLPEETLKKLCLLSVYNRKQVDYSIRLLKSLEILERNHSMLSGTIRWIIEEKELSSKEEESLILLIDEIGKEKLIGESFPSAMFVEMKIHLEEKSYSKVVIWLKVMESLVQSKSLYVCPLILLVYLSEIIGDLLWTWETFSVAKVEATELVCSIISLITDTLDDNDSNLEWVRTEILKNGEMNQALFCDLWFKFGKQWIGSGNLLSNILAAANSDRSDSLKKIENPIDCQIFLNLVFSFLTFRQCNSVVNSLLKVFPLSEILPLFWVALYNFSFHANSNPKSHSCFKYSFCNYARLIRVYSSEMDDKSLNESLNQIFLMVDQLEDAELQKCCMDLSSPDLLQVVRSMTGFNEKILALKRLEAFI